MMMSVLRKIGFPVLMVLFFGISALAQNVNVTATGGTANATYATVKAAFDAVNAGTHTGAITLEVVANTIEPSNTSAVLNSSGAGTASYTSLLIRPTADNITVSGAGGSGGTSCGGRGLIELNGADNVTIDGDNPNTSGTNRNLSFTNTCATNSVAVIRIAMSNLVSTANNIIFRNINVNGNAVGRNTPENSNINEPGNPTGYSYGIYAGGDASTTSTTNPPSTFDEATQLTGTAVANNLTIENSRFINSGRGINLKAATLTIFPNFLIRQNLIGNPNADAPDQIYHFGISASGSNNGTISDNTVYVESFLNIVQQGIAVGAGGSVQTTGVIVERNVVKRIKGNNLTGAGGNDIHVFTDFPNTVRNNFVSGVGNRVSGVFVGLIGAYGIFIGRGPGHKIYN